METAQLIEQAMRATGSLTRAELASLIRTPHRTLAGWSAGEYNPPPATGLLLRALADGRLSRAYLEAL